MRYGTKRVQIEVFPAPEEVACSCCGAKALTRLPTRLLAKQPDGTNIVCNPAHGGCNQGFATDAWFTPADAREALKLGKVLARNRGESVVG